MTTRSQGDLLVHWRQGPHKLIVGALPAPVVGFNGGDQVQTTVANVNLRATPSITGTIILLMPINRQLYVTGPPLIVDEITYTPVIYTDAATAGWASAALMALVTAGAAAQYIPVAEPTNIYRWNEGICTTTANFRYEPSTLSAIIRTIPIGDVVTLTGNNSGSFREADYGLERGWVLPTSFDFVGGTMPAFPAFTHRFTWHMDVNGSTFSDIAVQYAVQRILHDRRGWQRTGVRIDQVSDPAAALTLFRLVSPIVTTDGQTVVGGGGHCESHDVLQDIVRIRPTLYGRQTWVNGISHEFGHSLFKAWDTYIGNPVGVDPKLHWSLMGESRDFRGNVHLWPDADDIASVKDYWLAGAAPNFIDRPPE